MSQARSRQKSVDLDMPDPGLGEILINLYVFIAGIDEQITDDIDKS
jgi:hypothetical protein